MVLNNIDQNQNHHYFQCLSISQRSSCPPHAAGSQPPVLLDNLEFHYYHNYYHHHYHHYHYHYNHYNLVPAVVADGGDHPGHQPLHPAHVVSKHLHNVVKSQPLTTVRI